MPVIVTFFRIKLSMLVRQQCEHDIVEFLRHRIRVSHVALSRHVAWHLRVNKIRFMQTETNTQQKWKRQSINLFRFVSFENANVSRKAYFHIIIASMLLSFYFHGENSLRSNTESDLKYDFNLIVQII